MNALLYVALSILGIIVSIIVIILFGYLVSLVAVNRLKYHSSLIAKQINQDAERRHQETVAALQDIAKAIRECNEE